MEFLALHGFECEVADPVWLAKAHRGDFFVDLITGMSTGVISVNQSWVDRGTRSELFGVPVRVLAPEELIASKLFVTRRERFDGADIAHVIFGTNGQLDWERLLELAGENWQILLWHLVLYQYAYPAHSDYVPRMVWDLLIGRFRDELSNTNAKVSFRGSLIDPLMFAIDVNEWGLPDLHEMHRQAREPKIKNLCENPAA